MTRRLTRDQYLIRDVGELKRSDRVIYGLLFSVGLTALIAFVTGVIAGDFSAGVLSLLGGLVIGLFFMMPVFVPLVVFRKLVPATCWSFGCAGLIGISATILGDGWWNPYEAFVYSYIGLLVGVCIAFFRVGKYPVYKYATCRGCG